MLELFIIPSNEENANIERLIESFSGLVDDIFKLDDGDSVNDYEKDTPWYCIMKDNEYLDERLLVILDRVMRVTWNYDALCLFKVDLEDIKDPQITFQPRIMRHDVELDKNLHPIDMEKLQILKILDGWVYINGKDPYAYRQRNIN